MQHSRDDEFSSSQIPTPRFTGIFIPVEILEIQGLTPSEIILLSWIDALQCRQKGGCFASNSYLALKLHLKEKHVSDMISKLKSLNLIKQISFNGRIRILQTYTWFSHQQEADSCSTARQTPAKTGGSTLPKQEPPHIIESKVKSKEREREPPPELLFFGQYVRMPKTHYDVLILDHGEKKIAEYIHRINLYCESSGKTYKGYAATIRSWIAKDLEKALNKTVSARINANDQIPKSLNNDLEARLAQGRIEVHIDQFDLIQRKATKDNKPDYAKGYRYKDRQGVWVTT